MLQRRALPPIADALCIVAFVLAGRQSHDLDGGAAWLLTVLWPFAAGWFAASLLTGLYGGHGDSWRRLGVTWIAGTAVALVLRVLVTGRTAPPVFIMVALTFLGATTFGWRFVVLLGSRRARRSRPSGQRST